MRDIKFRGKIIPTGKWVCGCLTKYSENMSFITEDLIEGKMYKVKTETIGQYIGQKDDRGREIYEGDIVYYDDEEENFVVLWDEMTSRFTLQSEGLIVDFDNCFSNDLDIIGNIYENPEQVEWYS